MNSTDRLPKIKPLVYSCSGCSSVAQMANYLAIQLDRLTWRKCRVLVVEDFNMDQAKGILEDLKKLLK